MVLNNRRKTLEVDGQKYCSFHDSFHPFTSEHWRDSANRGYFNKCKTSDRDRLRAKRVENPEYRKIESARSSRYIMERAKNDPVFKLKMTLRIRLLRAIKGQYKSGSAVSDLGCSVKYFMEHMENKFLDGMSWENHGEWHIDHIAPLASFDLSISDELKSACHYTNLQPLWARDNISKGATI